MKKKVLSLLLCFALVLGIGMTAYASMSGATPRRVGSSSSQAAAPAPTGEAVRPMTQADWDQLLLDSLPKVQDQWVTSKDTLAYVTKGDKQTAIAVTKGTAVCVVNPAADKGGYIQTSVNGQDTFMLKNAFSTGADGKPKSALFID